MACNFLKECPVVAIVFEEPHAIELVRKLTGATEPRQALPRTILGDFSSIESYSLANDKKRIVRNLIHASDSKETAEKEISIWFKPKELHNQKILVFLSHTSVCGLFGFLETEKRY